MKKAKAILIIISLFLIIYFLQINFFSWFTIRGIMPNLFVCLVLVLGLFAGKKIGVIAGLITGVLLDLLLGKTIGFSGIFLAMIGLLGEYMDKNFSKDNLAIILMMIIGATVLYESCTYAVNTIKFSTEIELNSFIIILGIETVYNVLITIINYPLIKKIGYELEETFKSKKLLTRYF